uniref:TRL-like protein family n=1 Tax=candidate division WOR-3 bacterium TaxID=2052148 RepID=A0A7C1SG71_UNCW3
MQRQTLPSGAEKQKEVLMRKALLLGIIPVVCLTMLTGCIPGFYTVGTLYTSVRTPAEAVAYYGPTATQAAKVSKVTATNILGIIATGDASLEAAMKQGGISKVHHIDQEVTSILGLWSTYTIIVYGE